MATRTATPMPATGLASRMFTPALPPQEVFVTSVRLGSAGAWIVTWIVPDKQGVPRPLEVDVKADLSKLVQDELLKAAVEDTAERAEALFRALWA